MTVNPAGLEALETFSSYLPNIVILIGILILILITIIIYAKGDS